MLRICDLQELYTKPKVWAISERKGGNTWFLDFALDRETKEFDGVRDKYGKQKIYKSVNAVFEDIRRVTPKKTAVIITFED